MRQHATPLLLPFGDGPATPLRSINEPGGGRGVREAHIQQLVQDHPACLPIAEIDPLFANPVPICTELKTFAGMVDNLLITATGLPVLVECKLWRNPEGRREVVGQILDYARELSRWSAADLQREVSRRLKRPGNAMLDLVRAAHPSVDEMQFHDDLTINLRRGRFLLLIVGDGIREGVAAIADYLRAHAGLHFSFGLVELPIYVMPDGGRIVVPRVLARTAIIERTIVALPEGFIFSEAQGGADGRDIDRVRSERGEEQRQFWLAFLAACKLDDPEQPIPGAPRLGYLTFMLPAPGASCWLTVFRDIRKSEVGVFLSSRVDSAGDEAVQIIIEDWETVRDELGSARLGEVLGRLRIIDSKTFGPLTDADNRKMAVVWLAERVNVFVNVLRPHVRAAQKQSWS